MKPAFAVIWGGMLAKDMKRWLWYCCCPPSTSRTQAWRGGAMIAFVCSGLSGPLKDREGITGLQPLIVYQDYCVFQTKADHHQRARFCHSLTHLKDGWYLRKLMAVWNHVCSVLNDLAFWGFMDHVVFQSHSFDWLCWLYFWIKWDIWSDIYIANWLFSGCLSQLEETFKMFCLANRVKWECFPSENGMVLH